MKPRAPTYALFLHGIGSQRASFADFAQKKLSAALSRAGSALYARPVHYAPLFDMAATKFLKDVERKGASGNLSQRLAVSTLADALQYQGNTALREQINHVIDYEFHALRAPDEVTIFAHSLGCLAALDWLRTRDAVRRVRLITMGCNVGLFSLGQGIDVPEQVRAPGTWTSLWDEDDFLGFPLAVRAELAHVEDIEVSVGGWLWGWTGLAHVGYLEDARLWRTTIPKLLLGA